MNKGVVVSLYGSPIINQTEPDLGVVKMLEDFLDRAKQGNINGIAVACHFNDETSGQAFSGTHSYSVVGRLQSLQSKILNELET